MSLKEEKRDLLTPFQPNTPECVLEDCLEASSPKSLAYVLTLGFANAADAVEVLCVGYIMNEIDSLSKSEKGKRSPLTQYHSLRRKLERRGVHGNVLWWYFVWNVKRSRWTEALS